MLNNQSGEAALTIVAVVFFAVMLLLLTLLGVPFATSAVILIGSLVFIISFVNTDLALIILIFTMLLSPEFYTGSVSDRSVKIRADDIFIIVIFLGWIAKMAINKELGLTRATPLNRPIMIYIVLCLLTSFMAIIGNKIDILTSIFYVLKYIEYFLIFFMVSSNLKTVSQAKKFIFYLLVTCFIVCLYALIGGSGGGRVSAPFESGGIGGEPNTFAGYLIVMIGLLLGLIFNSKASARKFMLIGLLVLSLAALQHTLSRTGWASLFITIAVFMVLNKKNRILLVITLAVVIVILPLVASKEVHQRVRDTFTPYSTYNVMGSKIGLDESGTARMNSWKSGFDRWAKKPVLGHGIPSGAFIDNQYMRTLNETGILGFAAFAAILITVFKLAHNVYKTMSDDNFAQAVSVGFLSGFMGLFLFSAAAATFTIIRIMEPFWFLVAIIAVLPELEKDTPVAEIV